MFLGRIGLNIEGNTVKSQLVCTCNAKDLILTPDMVPVPPHPLLHKQALGLEERAKAGDRETAMRGWHRVRMGNFYFFCGGGVQSEQLMYWIL